VWRYLKAAFLVGVDVPALGRLPVNVLLASAFVILGFAEPAFWLAGMATEAALVTTLAFNPRFQKYVQGQQLQAATGDDDARRRQLIQLLEPDLRRKLSGLETKCQRVLDVYASQQTEDYIIDANRDALRNLQWTYLKLLVARHHLTAFANDETGDSIAAKVKSLERDIADPNEPDSLRQSKQATAAILKKRLSNILRKEQTFEEIDSDLTRIDAQVDLLLENATMQGKPQTITTDIQLASDLLGGGLFGEDESAITDLDKKYTAPKSRQQETAQ